MTYTKVFRRADGSEICSLTLLEEVRSWTLKEVVWKNRQDFLDTEGAEVFAVLDAAGQVIVEITRDQFDTGARSYNVDFVRVSTELSSWERTEKTAFITAWSQPLAMALAKELVPLHPPATGFELIDPQTRSALEGWDISHDA